ncbi:hypothetical protein GIB67_017913 [Kingdonia uniflora]|uniref:Uncharacterized protein n=1 Tax=Kingdonia uniflora TaxID=39325 RepID=A0A7J7NDY0_9MAGN|nr:hypothetical protein GIB67_017913 [Kingdonia uniflora]
MIHSIPHLNQDVAKETIRYLIIEVKKNVEEVAVSRDSLCQKLLEVGYAVADIKAIMEGHFVKVEEDEAEEEPNMKGRALQETVQGLDAVLARIKFEN